MHSFPVFGEKTRTKSKRLYYKGVLEGKIYYTKIWGGEKRREE